MHTAAQRLDEHGVVRGSGGAGSDRVSLLVGAPQDLGPERLRRLHCHQRAPVERAGHLPFVVHDLDGVTRRQPGDGPVGVALGHGADHRVEEGARRERAGGVVHDDHLGVRGHRGQTTAHRVGACRTARHHGVRTVRVPARIAVPVVVVRDDEDHAVGPGSARLYRVFEHRAARQQGILLQSAEAAPGAPGDNHRPHVRLGHGPGRTIRSARRSDALPPSPRPR